MKGILFLSCVLLVQIYAQKIMKTVANAPGCAPDQCCIHGSDQTLTKGRTAADTNGFCQEYVCNDDNTYTVVQCLHWTGPDCEVAPGKTNSLYPDCCQMPVKNSQCRATFSG